MRTLLCTLFIICYTTVTFGQWSGTVSNRTMAHFSMEVWENGSQTSSGVLPLGDGVALSGITSAGLVIIRDAAGSNIIGSALFIPGGHLEIGPDYVGNSPMLRENPDEPSSWKWVFVEGFGTGVGIFGFCWTLKIAKRAGGNMSDI